MITYILDIGKPASLEASCSKEHQDTQDNVNKPSTVGECHTACAHQPVLASICQDRFISIVVTEGLFTAHTEWPLSSLGSLGLIIFFQLQW